MSLRSILYYLSQPKIALLGLFLLLAVYLLYRVYRVRKIRAPRAKGPVLLRLDQALPPVQADGQASEEAPKTIPLPPPVPSFQTLQTAPLAVSDILHGALILLSLVVAAGFVLVLLPQGSFDRMAQGLQARRAGTAEQEQIAFLYLGDEIKDKEFHVRGVVRNITDQPLEKVDASIRLYAPDGRLLETAVVRMDKESIAPDETAEFHLMYPNYEQQIGSYSVDFKLRQGQIVLYKDMRAARPRE